MKLGYTLYNLWIMNKVAIPKLVDKSSSDHSLSVPSPESKMKHFKCTQAMSQCSAHCRASVEFSKIEENENQATGDPGLSK